MRSSTAILAMSCAMATIGVVGAGPLVLEESARIVSPEAGYSLAFNEVAVDGNSAIVVGSRPQPEPLDYLNDEAAFLFERDAAGHWNSVRKLVEHSQNREVFMTMRVAMRQGVAAVSATGGLRVFERTPSGWVSVPASGTPLATDLEIDAGTILGSSGTCSWDAEPFRKGPNGIWSPFGRITGGFHGCAEDFRGGELDISGNRAIVMNSALADFSFSEARIYEVGAAPPWVHVATLPNPAGPSGEFGPAVAIRGGTALVTGPYMGLNGSYPSGTYVFDRDTAGAWNLTGRIQWPEGLFPAWTVELRDGLALQTQADLDRGGEVVGVYQRQSGGAFKYVARLVAGGSGFNWESLGRSIAISGRRIVTNGSDAAYVYDLPASFAQPAVQQEDFQLGNASHWTPLAGSSFAVAGSATARVYRQSNVAGNAASLLGNTDWRNQSIEADVRPTAFSGADRWVGLVVRYQDAGNYYYVAMRSSNVIELKRIVNGVFVTLASATLPVTLNRNYRLRLQAVGTALKVFVNGMVVPQLQVADSSLQQGQAGVMMYRARADYDNVLVNPSPLQRVFETDFVQFDTHPWATTGQWSIVREGQSPSTFVLRQSDLSGGARAVTGVPLDDQTVTVRARPIGYSGADRWFGVIARYRDDGNYYYVTVRSSNVISLRKLVNGVIHDIASAPMTVTGATYTLQLEVIGSSLRVYVDNELKLQGTDTTHKVGTYGMATYKASASFDDFRAHQP